MAIEIKKFGYQLQLTDEVKRQYPDQSIVSLAIQDLVNVPDLTGQANKTLVVNNTETGIAFVVGTGMGGGLNSGTSFPQSPNNNDLFLLLENIAGFTKGLYQYQTSAWEAIIVSGVDNFTGLQGTIALNQIPDGLITAAKLAFTPSGGGLPSGTSFPASPSNNDLFLLLADTNDNTKGIYQYQVNAWVEIIGGSGMDINFTDLEGTIALNQIPDGLITNAKLATPPSDGSQGPQGRFLVRVYRSITHGDPAPATPTATSYNASNNTFVGLSSGWSITFPTNVDPARFDVYESFFTYDPASPNDAIAFGTPFKIEAEVSGAENFSDLEGTIALDQIANGLITRQKLAFDPGSGFTFPTEDADTSLTLELLVQETDASNAKTLKKLTESETKSWLSIQGAFDFTDDASSSNYLRFPVQETQDESVTWTDGDLTSNHYLEGTGPTDSIIGGSVIFYWIANTYTRDQSLRNKFGIAIHNNHTATHLIIGNTEYELEAYTQNNNPFLSGGNNYVTTNEVLNDGNPWTADQLNNFQYNIRLDNGLIYTRSSSLSSISLENLKSALEIPDGPGGATNFNQLAGQIALNQIPDGLITQAKLAFTPSSGGGAFEYLGSSTNLNEFLPEEGDFTIRSGIRINSSFTGDGRFPGSGGLFKILSTNWAGEAGSYNAGAVQVAEEIRTGKWFRRSHTADDLVKPEEITEDWEEIYDPYSRSDVNNDVDNRLRFHLNDVASDTVPQLRFLTGSYVAGRVAPHISWTDDGNNIYQVTLNSGTANAVTLSYTTTDARGTGGQRLDVEISGTDNQARYYELGSEDLRELGLSRFRYYYSDHTDTNLRNRFQVTWASAPASAPVSIWFENRQFSLESNGGSDTDFLSPVRTETTDGTTIDSASVLNGKDVNIEYTDGSFASVTEEPTNINRIFIAENFVPSGKVPTRVVGGPESYDLENVQGGYRSAILDPVPDRNHFISNAGIYWNVFYEDGTTAVTTPSDDIWNPRYSTVQQIRDLLGQPTTVVNFNQLQGQIALNQIPDHLITNAKLATPPTPGTGGFNFPGTTANTNHVLDIMVQEQIPESTGTTTTESVFDMDKDTDAGVYAVLNDGFPANGQFSDGNNINANWVLDGSLGMVNSPFFIYQIDATRIAFAGTGTSYSNFHDFNSSLRANIVVISRNASDEIKSVRLSELTRASLGIYNWGSVTPLDTGSDVDYAVVNTDILGDSIDLDTGIITTTTGATEASHALRKLSRNETKNWLGVEEDHPHELTPEEQKLLDHITITEAEDVKWVGNTEPTTPLFVRPLFKGVFSEDIVQRNANSPHYVAKNIPNQFATEQHEDLVTDSVNFGARKNTGDPQNQGFVPNEERLNPFYPTPGAFINGDDLQVRNRTGQNAQGNMRTPVVNANSRNFLFSFKFSFGEDFVTNRNSGTHPVLRLGDANHNFIQFSPDAGLGYSVRTGTESEVHTYKDSLLTINNFNVVGFVGPTTPSSGGAGVFDVYYSVPNNSDFTAGNKTVKIDLSYILGSVNQDGAKTFNYTFDPSDNDNTGTTVTATWRTWSGADHSKTFHFTYDSNRREIRISITLNPHEALQRIEFYQTEIYTLKTRTATWGGDIRYQAMRTARDTNSHGTITPQSRARGDIKMIVQVFPDSEDPNPTMSFRLVMQTTNNNHNYGTVYHQASTNQRFNDLFGTNGAQGKVVRFGGGFVAYRECLAYEVHSNSDIASEGQLRAMLNASDETLGLAKRQTTQIESINVEANNFYLNGSRIKPAQQRVEWVHGLPVDSSGNAVVDYDRQVVFNVDDGFHYMGHKNLTKGKRSTGQEFTIPFSNVTGCARWNGIWHFTRNSHKELFRFTKTGVRLMSIEGFIHSGNDEDPRLGGLVIDPTNGFINSIWANAGSNDYRIQNSYFGRQGSSSTYLENISNANVDAFGLEIYKNDFLLTNRADNTIRFLDRTQTANPAVYGSNHISLNSGNTQPRGLSATWSEDLYVVNKSGASSKYFVYDLSTRARKSSLELNMLSGNEAPEDCWSDGVYIFNVNTGDPTSHLYCQEMVDGDGWQRLDY